MLSFPSAIKVYLCTVPCDMRRSFNGLSMMAEHVVRGNPLFGHLFVFCNRRADRLKILYWNHDGLAIWYKRLEVGTFAYPFSETGRKEIAAWELAVLLEGIDLRRGRRPNSTTCAEPRDITEVACWAHCRRKFYEAQSSDLMRSTVMLAYIRLLYDVEREAQEAELDGPGRRALRQSGSVSILEDIKAYLLQERPNVLPKSAEGQAIAYTLSNWPALIRYCEDGDLEIDNNGAERSLRGIAVGRKNWMFFGSDNGGQTAAILTSLIATCKRLNIDPFAYLRDIFDRISAHPANRIEELLPDKWQTVQKSTT